MFKNMKIEINEQQPLDDVLNILKGKGYKIGFQLTKKPTWVTLNNHGSIGFFSFQPSDTHFQLTTLAELKEM